MDELSEESAERREFHQGMLDESMLLQLFADLEGAAEVSQVIIKGGEGAYAASGSLSLAQGQALFLAQKVRGLQIRYRFEGTEWWDTLLYTPNGVRVVRIAQDDWDA